jgi:GNAT superfamily N-acetyltransferase
MSEPSAAALREGSGAGIVSVSVRRVEPGDEGALRDFYGRLSSASRRRRFMSTARELGAARTRAFCLPDHRHAEGFLALLRTAGPDDGLIVGHLCMEPASQDAAEVAIAVADEVQLRGIGRRLFEAALAWAIESGYRRVVATAFADNWPVFRLLSSAPLGLRMWPAEGGLVDIEIPLLIADEASCTPAPGVC